MSNILLGSSDSRFVYIIKLIGKVVKRNSFLSSSKKVNGDIKTNIDDV